MTPSTSQAAPTSIDRREAIRRAALLLGAFVSPSLVGCAERALPARSGTAAAARYLTPAEFALVAAVADRILPRTDTPGAVDVGVPSFIDLAYGEFMTAGERTMLADGLASLEAESAATRRTTFASLTPDQQDELLRAVARASQDLDRSFFRQMREATILGYFTSEEVGRKVLHYDPVPGRYDPCVPIGDVGSVVWTT
jgi:hypothetical protein